MKVFLVSDENNVRAAETEASRHVAALMKVRPSFMDGDDDPCPLAITAWDIDGGCEDDVAASRRAVRAARLSVAETGARVRANDDRRQVLRKRLSAADRAAVEGIS